MVGKGVSQSGCCYQGSGMRRISGAEICMGYMSHVQSDSNRT